MLTSAVDLFCGVGGLTYGMQRGGIPVACGIDIDPACQYPYEENNGSRFIEMDVSDLTPSRLKRLFQRSDYRVLVGCAPCQPFSSYSHGLATKRDDRWKMLDVFGMLIVDVLPDIVSMENVLELVNQPIYVRFLNRLKRAGYHVTEKRANCPDYGIPQERRRLVVLASLHGSLQLQSPDCKKRTVRDAIGNLPRIKAGEVSPCDPLHRSQSLSDLNLKRMRASKPGGTWHDWDADLVAKCHRTRKGSSFKSVYARMSWGMPSPTITTQFYKFGTGRFGHPSQNRALSLREGAILQTFPRHYRFISEGGVITFDQLGRLIGNAVPVRLGEVIAQSIKEHLRQLS